MTRKSVVSFSKEEADFLNASNLARIATVSPSGQPHVVPVGFEFDGEFFYFGGYNLTKSLKFKNIQKNNKVGLAIDDLVSVKPWRPRFIIIRGTAEILKGKNPVAIDAGTYIKITPRVKRSTFER